MKKHKDFVHLTDFTGDELAQMLDLADEMKKNPNEFRTALKGKTLGMIFNKNSTRTRVSFEAGIFQLGGLGFYYAPGQLQLSRGEPISDTAQVLSRYLDGIMIRTFAHTDVTELAKYATIPVINGLTDYNHPCQMMADVMAIREKFGRNVKGLKMAFVGDGNNVATSTLHGCVKFGMDCAIVTPKDYSLPTSVVDMIRDEAKQKGVKITLTNSIEEGVKGANVVYTDVWASMGQEEEQAKRVKAFSEYQVNDAMMKIADKNAVFMHCLPAHRGEEVAASVIDGKQSIVFDEAENRLHAQKAVLYTLMK